MMTDCLTNMPLGDIKRIRIKVNIAFFFIRRPIHELAISVNLFTGIDITDTSSMY